MKTDDFKWVTSYLDRHGKRRFRYRRTGFPVHNFRSEFGSDEFVSEYAAASSEDAKERFRLKKEEIAAQRRRKGLSGWNADKGKSYVYFISAAGGPIKIGYTNDIQERLTRLQVSNHKEIRLLLKMPGTRETEAAIHRLFDAHRIRGEWFKRCPEIIYFVRKGWRTMNGEPAGEPLKT